MSDWDLQVAYGYPGGQSESVLIEEPAPSALQGVGVLLILLGLVVGVAVMPCIWIFAKHRAVLGIGGVVVFLVPVVAGPLFFLGFYRPAYAFLAAAGLGVLDFRLGGRFGFSQPVYGITTNVSNIVLLLVFFQSFLWRWRRGVPWALWVYAVGILGGGLIGIFVAKDSDAALEAYVMRGVIPMGIVINMLRTTRGRQDLELIWRGLLILLMGTVLYNLLLTLARGSFDRQLLGGNAFSAACAMLLPVAILWGLGRENRPGLIWLGRIACLFLLTQVWLQSSRAAIGATAAYLLLMLVLRFRRVFRSPLFVLGVALFVGLGLSYLGGSVLAEAGGKVQLERYIDLWRRGITGTARWRIWQEASGLAGENLLTGIGMNNFLNASGFKYGHPHNVELGMLLDTGILGLAGFIVLVVFVALALTRAIRQTPPGTYRDALSMARAMFLILLAILQVESYVYSGKLASGAWIFHIVAALALMALAARSDYRRAEAQVEEDGYPDAWPAPAEDAYQG